MDGFGDSYLSPPSLLIGSASSQTVSRTELEGLRTPRHEPKVTAPNRLSFDSLRHLSMFRGHALGAKSDGHTRLTENAPVCLRFPAAWLSF